jgi:hypothetical protein
VGVHRRGAGGTGRGRWWLAVLALAGLVAARVAEADEKDLNATATCERRTTKGRVLCEVEMETPEGRIPWADVVVVRAPPFAPPLRSRVGPGDARVRTDRRVRIPVAFVATALGQGEVAFRGRAVVCRAGGSGAERCVPETREVTVELVVGTVVQR